MNMVRFVGGLVVLTVVVVFGAQNTQAVTLHFLIFKVPTAPLVLALFAAVVLGVLLGWIVSVPGRFRRMRQRQQLEGQIVAHDRAAAMVNTEQPHNP